MFICSVAENASNVSTTISLLKEGCLVLFLVLKSNFSDTPGEDINGTSTGVVEKVLECDFSFSVSREHSTSQTTLVGHVGKNASMSFLNPGKFFQ